MSSSSKEEAVEPVRSHSRNSALEDDLIRLRELAIGGDLDAAEDFALRFTPYALVVLREFRLQEAEQADCLQELWGKIFDGDMRALRRWRGEGQLRTYLATIARRIVLDMFRRRAVLGNATAQAWEREQEATRGHDASDFDPFAVMEAAQGRHLVSRGLESLGQRYRQVLVLRYYCDRKHREIGEMLGIPTAQVGITLQRAEQALAKVLRDLATEKA